MPDDDGNEFCFIFFLFYISKHADGSYDEKSDGIRLKLPNM